VLVTDARGDADSAEIPVALVDLEAASFGAGDRVDHLTLAEVAGLGVYVSDPVPYTVP
jgi:hypothetical protein